MQAGAVRRRQVHDLHPPPLGRRLATDCKSRYTNLCAFASDLTRENIDLLAWEGIMTTSFIRARNNMPSRASTQGNAGVLEIREGYLRGAEAWVNYNVIRKSIRDRRLSRESWRMWQTMFAQANRAYNRASPGRRNSVRTASRQIERALQSVDDQLEAQNPREAYTPRARLLRIPAST